ncbi:DUF6473 family protein [Limimaricola cinnabarinus]|uniref:DUF6473 domain-containing protein n=1 Tax=Limimaricola cinnabarinus LL-001 TaxID=1337093 RepID=U2YLD9_9RHOB|nr:DUF6473 family protein [Limimaricola cinnabarinus]GAD55876.1 hypothetical protein MBELCI_1928 [Limimaricola cinnabarinus LL-001]
MKHDRTGLKTGDIARVCYKGSRLEVRGPERLRAGRYIACPGGTETFGPGMSASYVALLEERTGLECVNLGALNAGAGAFLGDRALLDICNRAERVVLQITGAQGLSNRLYTVHPRRNDRFLRASATLRALYPEVDFTEFCFVRHMLSSLQDLDPVRFATLRAELHIAWTMRMRKLISCLASPVTLVLLPERRGDGRLGDDPLFVTGEMVNDLRPIVSGIVAMTTPDLSEAMRHRAIAEALEVSFARQTV